MQGMMLEWLNAGFRLFHVVAAIAWIGASFYFIWLDLSLEEPPRNKRDRGVKGDLWSIHGGGIYEISKYRLAPPRMPETLHWFKWEAYTTWLTGSGLLVLLYYVQAQSYLVGNGTWLQSPAAAIGGSICFLAAGQLVYEILVRSALGRRAGTLAVALLVTLSLASWLVFQLFSARAAYIHMGALIGTWMAGNVFWGIIPAQKAFVADVGAGREPDPERARFAKLRSTHNNYLTLPVVFAMLSNHYPFLYGGEYAWFLLVVVGALLAWIRHFFNLRHQGQSRPGVLIGAGLALVCVALLTAFAEHGPGVAETNDGMAASLVSRDSARAMVAEHCSGCHAREPTMGGFQAPPAGLVFESETDLLNHRSRSLTAISSGYMPLGNQTDMSKEERGRLLRWLESQ
ncbi:urate hydroxylase PuuD [Vreelandella utahensis]|uniref:urate hydroxylase PuuD n=1 Tax=Vreelandella halophila TaxID=86177 RepID=UPI000984AF71|nr:urate hydroxylase PuuD [Halomonas utahensis]